ncbi:phage tail family protein [Bacillus cereus]
MVVGNQPDRYYNVRYSGALPINDLIKNRFFTLPLIAYDPHAYSIVESTEDVLWGDDIPFMSDITFGIGADLYTVTNPQTLNIDNFGSQVVRPIVEISGSATSLTLTIQGESFSIGTFTNSTIVIDAERYAAIKNGQNFLFQLQGNLEKLEIMSGTNAINIGGSNLNINIAFKYRAKYV